MTKKYIHFKVFCLDFLKNLVTFGNVFILIFLIITYNFLPNIFNSSQTKILHFLSTLFVFINRSVPVNTESVIVYEFLKKL